MIVHAGLLAVYGAGRWRGALIEGPSGAGKSDLALRCLEQDWRLAADDRVRLWRSGPALYGASPSPIAGLMEIRGLGIIAAAPRPLVSVDLIVVCAPAGESLERLPEVEHRSIEGVHLPVVRLHALQSSAPAKLRRALCHLGVRP